MDGYLKIKTKIDNKDIDKDIVELENKMKKLQTDNSKLSQEQDTLKREIQQYEELTQKADSYRNQIKILQKEKENMVKTNPNLVVSTSPELNNINTQLESIKQKYANATKEIDKQAPKVDKLYSKLEKIKTQQTENNSKIAQYRQQIEEINTNNIQNSLNNVGKNLQNQIGKIGKMAMAVVGIRTAWYAVRGVINSVSEYNDQISTDFEYMRYSLANMFVPIVEKIVQLLYTVLGYINAIASAWFGINLFGNASVKNFQKMQNSANGTAKASKEIAKSLTGFDEMNVVSDSSSSGNSGGSAGAIAPSVDLSGLQGDIPSWLQWIIDNKDVILSIISGITGALISLKIIGLKPLMSLGIGITLGAIVQLVQDIITFIKDPSWQNFLNILRDISLAFVGIGVIIGVLTKSWIPLLIAAIALIVVEVVKHWDEIMEILKPIGQWIYDNVITPVWNFIKGLVDVIVEIFKTLISIIDGIFTTLLNILIAPFQTWWDMVQDVYNGVKEIFEGIAKVFKGIFTGDMKTTLEGFKQIFKGVFDALWGIAKAPLNLIIRGINALIKGANKIKFDVPDWVPGMGGKVFGFNIPEIPLLRVGGIVNNPGRGVPIGRAIAGEAGAEGVIPLTDSQAMETLGEAIGRYITINANITNSMNGRVISRQLKKIQANKDFAYNT